MNLVAAGAFAPGATEVLRQEGHWQRQVQILEMLRSPGGLTEPWFLLVKPLIPKRNLSNFYHQLSLRCTKISNSKAKRTKSFGSL